MMRKLFKYEENHLIHHSSLLQEEDVAEVVFVAADVDMVEIGIGVKVTRIQNMRNGNLVVINTTTSVVFSVTIAKYLGTRKLIVGLRRNK